MSFFCSSSFYSYHSRIIFVFVCVYVYVCTLNDGRRLVHMMEMFSFFFLFFYATITIMMMMMMMTNQTNNWSISVVVGVMNKKKHLFNFLSSGKKIKQKKKRKTVHLYSDLNKTKKIPKNVFRVSLLNIWEKNEFSNINDFSYSLYSGFNLFVFFRYLFVECLIAIKEKKGEKREC